MLIQITSEINSQLYQCFKLKSSFNHDHYQLVFNFFTLASQFLLGKHFLTSSVACWTEMLGLICNLCQYRSLVVCPVPHRWHLHLSSPYDVSDHANHIFYVMMMIRAQTCHHHHILMLIIILPYDDHHIVPTLLKLIALIEGVLLSCSI